MGVFRVLTPNSKNAPDDLYIVENLDYRKHFKFNNTEYDRYYISSNSNVFNSTQIESLIKGDFDGYSVYIVKKVGIKSYYFDDSFLYSSYLNKCYFSVAELEVKAVVHNGEETKREVGSKIFVTENYGIDHRGTFVNDNSSQLYSYSGDSKSRIMKGNRLKNNTYYLLILSNANKVNLTENDQVYCSYFDYVFPKPINNFPYLDYDSYDYVELSKPTYDRALDVIENSVGYTDFMYGCSQMVLYAYENYGNVLPEVKDNSQIEIGLYITTTICIIESLALIIITVIILKRKKSTSSGTPPTVEQNSPDAQNTPNTPIAEAKNASPPDVTEPPDPPKEE
jgi:hypothetical protein